MRNHLYIGEVRHRKQWYPGDHSGVVPRDLWDNVQALLDNNVRRRDRRARDQSPSLLTGLIEDGEGNRLTPSFTIKSGRRYRYYVSQCPANKASGERKAPIRLPAHEVETRVTERLWRFLQSDGELFDELNLAGDSPALLHQFAAAAKRTATKLRSLSLNDLRNLLASIVRSVIIRENEIQIMIRGGNLRQLLEHGDQVIAAKVVGHGKPIEPTDLICLTIEARRKQYGGEVHLVVAPNSGTPIRHPRPALIKAVARGHAWYERLIAGKVVDIRSLAGETGLTPHYVRNVLACAFLAPDIVDAILEGRQPITLKFENLYKHIPLSWVEQRQRFGFPQSPSSR